MWCLKCLDFFFNWNITEPFRSGIWFQVCGWHRYVGQDHKTIFFMQLFFSWKSRNIYFPFRFENEPPFVLIMKLSGWLSLWAVLVLKQAVFIKQDINTYKYNNKQILTRTYIFYIYDNITIKNCRQFDQNRSHPILCY